LVEESGWPLVPFFEEEKVETRVFDEQIWFENKFKKQEISYN
jgi:hypothetical protein